MKVWLAFSYNFYSMIGKTMNKYSNIGSVLSDLLDVLMKEQNPNYSVIESIWDDVGNYVKCWKSWETRAVIE